MDVAHLVPQASVFWRACRCKLKHSVLCIHCNGHSGSVPKPSSSHRALGWDSLKQHCLFPVLPGSATSPVAAVLFHGETHTLASTAGKIIIYTLATTLSSPRSSGNPRLARTGSGKAPLQGQDPHGEEDQSQVDEVLSQLEQLVDLLEQYFHPSNNGRSVGITPTPATTAGQ